MEKIGSIRGVFLVTPTPFSVTDSEGGCDMIWLFHVTNRYSIIPLILMLLPNLNGLRRGLQAKTGQDGSDPPFSRGLTHP